MSEATIYVKGQNIPVTEADDRDLTYWEGRIAKELDEGTSRYPDRDQKRLEAVRAELAHRAGGAPREAEATAEPAPAARQAAPAQSRQLARASTEGLAGSWADGAALSTQLAKLQEHCNLVSPATTAPSLPEGCEVAVSLVRISDADTYSTGGGKKGLAKAALEQIAGAAGVTWDPALCRRVDDRRDPHYCAVEVVGYVRGFDGSVRTITGDKELDLREGSPNADAIRSKARDGKDAEKQLREMRQHIQSHAYSKAKLRAIRSLGVRTGYTDAELAKPFAVARLMFTGPTSDPALRREFARMQATAMVGGMSQLYGTPAPAALPAPAVANALPRSAPPLDRTGTDDDFPEDY